MAPDARPVARAFEISSQDDERHDHDCRVVEQIAADQQMYCRVSERCERPQRNQRVHVRAPVPRPLQSAAEDRPARAELHR